MTSEVAERYAQGLFELAKETHTVEEKKADAETLLQVIESDSGLIDFLKAVKVTRAEKKAFIETVLTDRFDQDLIRFLKLIIDKGRITYLKEILQAFISLTDDELGIVRAVVESARALKQEDLDRITESLVKKTGKKIVLSNKVDPALIAGIKVVVGNNVTDVTMKNKIDSLKGALLKGGQQA